MSSNFKLKIKATDVDVSIGCNLRRVRRMKGFTQQAVANEVGVSFQQIQKYENGKNRISASTLLSLAKLMQVSPNFLLNPSDTDQKDLYASTNILDNETIELIRLFQSIKDKKIRKNIQFILRRMAENADGRKDT